MTDVEITVTLNGEATQLAGATNTTLADALRDRGLKGTKISCDQGVCGACTVLVDGVPTAACMTFLFMVNGKRVETIEGLSKDGRLHPVQQAFVDCSAFQCGFCTPGMVMLVKGMFDAVPDPDHETVTRWLSTNICRCTGYAPIFRAVERARAVIRN
jgi:carbon-monoxide dehydrogenase small subunit